MSYRTYVNDTQIFGNNEAYPEWFEYLRSKGIHCDKEGNYEAELDNFMEALEVMEQIVVRLITEREKLIKINLRKRQIYDGHSIYEDYLEQKKPDYGIREGLLGLEMDFVKNGYFYMPLAFYAACKEMLEPATKPINNRLDAYVLKPGCKIRVRAG